MEKDTGRRLCLSTRGNFVFRIDLDMLRPIRFDIVLRGLLILIWLWAVEWPGSPLITIGPPQHV